MTDLTPSVSGRVRRLVPVALGIALTALCVAFVIQTLNRDWSRVHHELVHASTGWLAVGLGCGAAAMTLAAWTWGDAMRIAGGRLPRRKIVACFFVGEIGKYLPGAIWASVGRAELAQRNGVARNRAYPSVVLSMVGLYLAAALGAAIVLPFSLTRHAHVGPVLLLLLLVPIGLGCLHPAVLTAARDLLARLLRRPIDVVIPPWRSSVGLIARYLPAWVGIVVATWCVARALPGVDAPVLPIALATLLSWLAGFVTPTPAGAGVREAVFIAVSGLAAGPAVAVAVASRLIFVVVDVVGALLSVPGARRELGAPGSVASGALGDERSLTTTED